MHSNRHRFPVGLPAALLVLLVLLAGCPAPASRPADGEIAIRVNASLSSGRLTFDNSRWGSVLDEASRNGLIDYEALAGRRSDLESYLEAIATADLGALAPQELKALLINAYNALTLHSVLLHPNISTIKSISGVWDKTRHTVGGFEVTLNEIEHNLLRPFFKDPRIHFAVNCASLSCAPLPSWAYDGANLDDQLEAASHAFLVNSANARLEDGKLRLSRYFDWYGTDFIAQDWEPHADTIAEFVARYAGADIAEAVAADATIEISFLEYDWSLNSSQ